MFIDIYLNCLNWKMDFCVFFIIEYVGILVLKIFLRFVFLNYCVICVSWMRFKYIIDYRILCLVKIDGDLVFLLCVEEGGGGIEFFWLNWIVSVLFCGYVFNILYLWIRCLDMVDIKLRISWFMIVNNIMWDVYIY